jgi:hypothetical protein
MVGGFIIVKIMKEHKEKVVLAETKKAAESVIMPSKVLMQTY